MIDRTSSTKDCLHSHDEERQDGKDNGEDDPFHAVVGSLHLDPFSSAVPTQAAATEAAGDDGEDEDEEQADDDAEGVAHEALRQLRTANK